MQQEQSVFIGHERELDTFRAFLDERGTQAHSVLFFHERSNGAAAQGGIGKSWLLRECKQDAEKRDHLAVVMIDFFSIQDRDSVAIARRIVDALKTLKPDWTPTAFENAFKRYQQVSSEREKIDPLRELHNALRQDLTNLQQAFNDTRRHLLVFCDTYERVARYPGALSLLPSRHFLETYHIPAIAFVMAGRDEPNWKSPYWHTYQQNVQSVMVHLFSLGETTSYLERHLSTNGTEHSKTMGQVAKLQELTQGRPILIGLLVDLLNSRTIVLEQLLEIKPLQFENYLMGKIHSMETLASCTVFFMAHIHHRLNQDMLQWLFQDLPMSPADAPPDTMEKTWQQLLQFSFVRPSATTNDIALHDEMRRMVVERIWQSEDNAIDGIHRDELSESIIRYYQTALADEKKAALHATYQIEQLYHKIYLDPVKNFELFRNQMDTALKLKQNSKARTLFQEIQELTTLFSEKQRYQMAEFEAGLLKNEEDLVGALHLYQKLLTRTVPQETPSRKAELLLAQGECYNGLNQFSRSIYTLTRASEIFQEEKLMKRLGVCFSRIGYAYTKQGILETAVAYYQESIKIASEQDNPASYADGLNSLAGARRLQGKLMDALRDSRASLLIRERLFREGIVSDTAVAYSLTVLGDVYYDMGDKAEAKRLYKRADKIYEQNSQQSSLALIYNRFGLLALDHGDLKEAEERFQQAYEIGLDYNKETALESLHNQSYIHTKNGHYKKAIALLQQALTQAKEMGYVRQQTTWLIEMAEILTKAGRLEEVQSTLAEAAALATPHHYYLLLGRIAEIRGDYLYQTESFIEAFQFYTYFCYYMALYNEKEYDNAVQKVVIKQLFELPEGLLQQIRQQISNDWTNLYLDEGDVSLMMQTLDEIKKLLNL